jgi:hypothetical protein
MTEKHRVLHQWTATRLSRETSLHPTPTTIIAFLRLLLLSAFAFDRQHVHFFAPLMHARGGANACAAVVGSANKLQASDAMRRESSSSSPGPIECNAGA